MAKKRRNLDTTADRVLDASHDSVLDVLDHLLNKGVTLTGDVTLGVAGVDLVYLRLSALLCAADRLQPPPVLDPAPRPRKSRPALVRGHR